jgi:hypothetical protein
MEEDRNLIRELLVRLAEIEKSLDPGANREVQPPYEGVRNPITVPGYDVKQIDAHLQLLVKRRLVDTGGVTNGPLIGIWFSHLTDAGHRAIRQTG